MRPALRTALVLVFAQALPALASDLECYEEPGSRKTTCINTREARANGTTRASPIYSGGPNGVKKTSFMLVADCAKGVSTLQDKQGVNFAGGSSNTTKASRSLTAWLCEIPKVKTDPSLRQF